MLKTPTWLLPGGKTPSEKKLEDAIRKHKGRVTTASFLMAGGWVASSYWSLLGFLVSAEETGTATFVGFLEALLASVIAATVVAGCSGLLMAFAASGDDHA